MSDSSAIVVILEIDGSSINARASTNMTRQAIALRVPHGTHAPHTLHVSRLVWIAHASHVRCGGAPAQRSTRHSEGVQHPIQRPARILTMRPALTCAG
mmetsp:Transcript_30546/g.50580  ORF Transcript_30546/g.50580 Transcript_30546/m.50580 type:complete len:98 (-) Transcript_30546:1114-1407(-)